MKRNDTALVLDHVIVFHEDPEAAVAPFVNAGYRERPPRVHQGQGTRNQSVQLTPSIFLEFLCVHDVDEAKTSAVRLDRYLRESASPYGLAWRGTTPPRGFWRDVPAYDIPFELWMAPHTKTDVGRPLEFALVDTNAANAEAADPIAVTIQAPLPFFSAGEGVTFVEGAPAMELAFTGALEVMGDGVSIVASRPLAKHAF